MKPRIKLKSLLLRVAIGIAAGLLATEAAVLIQGFLASKRIHASSFPAPPADERVVREAHSVLVNHILASGTEFGKTLGIAISRDWLVTLQMGNRLAGLNLRSGSIRDLSSFFKMPLPQCYAIWSGRLPGEVFLGSPSRSFTQFFLTADGSPTGIRSLNRGTELVNSVSLANERWVSNGYFRDGTTLLFNRLANDSLKKDEPIRKPVFPGLSALVSLEANRNELAVRPDRRLVAQAFLFAPLIYVYDGTGKLQRSIAGPISISQIFGERRGRGDVRMRYLPQTRHCYISVATTNERVIALYSGKTIAESNTKVEGSQLHVFSWDGQLLRILNLDSSVSLIALSSDGAMLYAVRREPNPAVLEYALPKD